MENNAKEKVEDIFKSIKKGETFSAEIGKEIDKELNRLKKEAIRYNSLKKGQ